MIQEYYLHMLFGINGEFDQTTGAGRLAIATLMSGYGLNASTKKDLQTRVGWHVTPGCFLGQKELSPTDYYCRNYEETRFAVSLVPFRKVNRTMNYQLDWSIVEGEWDFKVTSPIWICLAKIYWAGYLMFGRNVIPERVLEILRSRFNPGLSDNTEHRKILNNHFVMQFLKNIGVRLENIRHQHLFTGRHQDLSRKEIFFSLVTSINPNDNAPGFYAASAMLKDFPAGQVMRENEEFFRPFLDSRVGRSRAHNFPLMQQYYYSYGLGAPTVPNTESRMPSRGNEIIPLFFCNTELSPVQEAANRYAPVKADAGCFNLHFAGYNIVSWLTAAVLWEYHLFLFGQALFPIGHLTAIREEKGWSQEGLLESLVYLTPANNKNSSVAQIARFHLERQLQV